MHFFASHDLFKCQLITFCTRHFRKAFTNRGHAPVHTKFGPGDCHEVFTIQSLEPLGHHRCAVCRMYLVLSTLQVKQHFLGQFCSTAAQLQCSGITALLECDHSHMSQTRKGSW